MNAVKKQVRKLQKHFDLGNTAPLLNVIDKEVELHTSAQNKEFEVKNNAEGGFLENKIIIITYAQSRKSPFVEQKAFDLIEVLAQDTDMVYVTGFNEDLKFGGSHLFMNEYDKPLDVAMYFSKSAPIIDAEPKNVRYFVLLDEKLCQKDYLIADKSLSEFCVIDVK